MLNDEQEHYLAKVEVSLNEGIEWLTYESQEIQKVIQNLKDTLKDLEQRF